MPVVPNVNVCVCVCLQLLEPGEEAEPQGPAGLQHREWGGYISSIGTVVAIQSKIHFFLLIFTLTYVTYDLLPKY